MVLDADGPQLSTSRINRLLRPLRNRCTSLMVLSAETRRLATCVTYSSRSGGSIDADFGSAPPLSILQPPSSIGTHLHFEKYNSQRLELSRKIYGIRDCFRDIVTKTQEHGRNGKRTYGASNRVISLSSLCAIYVGENISCETGQDNLDDIENTDLINELYEIVPTEHRRWTVLSHSLTHILKTTVHNVTLLTILLDVALAHGLFHESNTLLKALLTLAFSPDILSKPKPPICHPAHANFLIDLRARWNTAGFAERAFLHTFLKVISTAKNGGAWASKAVQNLIQGLCHSDFPSFIQVLNAYASAPTDNPKTKTETKAIDSREPTHTHLLKLITMGFDHYLSWSMDGFVEPCMIAETSEAVLDFVKSCLTSDSDHRTALSEASETFPELQDPILSFATHWLSRTSDSANPTDLTFVVNKLRKAVPHTSTYTRLVAKIFSSLSFAEGQEALHSFSQALRSFGLLRLEASILACTLRHIERSECERVLLMNNDVDQIRSYRHCLMDLVDDAEKRCFGQDPTASPLSMTPTPDDALDRGDREWQWEATIGCWVRNAQPSAKKKRKVEGDHRLRSLTFPLRHSDRTSLHRGSWRQSTRSDSGPYLGRCNDGYHPESSGEFNGTRPPLLHKQTNFVSLLADATSKRASLHSERKDYIELESPSPPPERECDPWDSWESQPSFPPSDDFLNLFAYPQSSPATVRR